MITDAAPSEGRVGESWATAEAKIASGCFAMRPSPDSPDAILAGDGASRSRRGDPGRVPQRYRPSRRVRADMLG